MQYIMCMHTVANAYVLYSNHARLPSHLGLSDSAWPRPHELRIGVERNGVKGARTEVGTHGTCDAVEERVRRKEGGGENREKEN